MMWLKIKVLLWKSLQLRKRHWFSTIIEIIVPCLLFFLINYVKSQFSNDKTSESTIVNQTIPNPVPEDTLYLIFRNLHSTGHFIYTPQTKETEQIMEIVQKNLDIAYDNIETAINEDDMINKFKIKFNNTDGYSSVMGFGIVFEETLKSQALKYKIRSTNELWLTDHLFPPYEIPGPMDYGDEYLNYGFLALQLTIDKAFVLMSANNKSGLNLNDYNLEIQSYPYASYLKDSSFQELFSMFLPLFTVLSFLLMCSHTIKRVVEEKDSGVKELMKIMGLKPWMIWTGWILHNFFIYAISITFITYITCFETPIGQGKLLNYTNPLLLWIFLMMYMIAGIFFCFAISSLFNRPLIALIVGSSVWCLTYTIPKNFMKPSTSILIQTLFTLFPNFAVSRAYIAISSLETQGKGLQFSTLFTAAKGGNSFSVGFILMMFVIDCFLYGFFAWYIDSVMPGKFGVAKPFYFFCKWPKNKTENNVMVPISKSNSRLFEKPPDNYEVGISIQNLHKHFGNFYAVNGVNLDLYKGQITALLGHNGAGKTTTMSIITGLFSPTYGTINVNGNDLFSNIDDFRQNLGLCPQHNLLFSYLTTLDHLIFFGMLKGLPLKNAKSEGLHLLELLNILQKKNELVSNLSGGMKRKLSLAIALVGNPKILILDEPTSGMDPESRREMWDLLLSFRGTRTILITTHFMEEADVLGDRIAIMDHGQVKCYGSSLFLKKAYGTGYNLTIVKEEPCNESNIIEAIKKIIPEAEIQSSLTAQVVINLPNDNTDQFPDVFSMLEFNREKFSIKGMGISCTTMEEVFLKAERNIHNDDDNDISSINTPVDAGTYQLIITKDVDCKVDQVTNLIQQYVPEFILMANMEMQVIFNLPARKRNQFAALFSALEFQKQNFGLKNVKITNSTTGDIYPNSVAAGDDRYEPKQPSNNDITQTLMPKYTNGLNLMKNQFKVLLEKKAIYTYRRWLLSLFFGIGPILLGLLITRTSSYLVNQSVVSQALNISLSTYKDSSVYYRAGDNSSENLEPMFVAISKLNKATVNETSSENNIINDLLKMCKDDVFNYRTNLMIAGDFNKTKSTVIYNNIAIHTPAIAVNLYSNALLHKLSGNNDSFISTVNEPIHLDTINICDERLGVSLAFLWITTFTPGLLYLIGYFIALPLNERVSGIKHLQMMTKLSPIMYWVTCFIWDYFCYIIVVLSTLVGMYLMDKNDLLTDFNDIGVLLTLLLIYGWSAIFYAYVYSYFKKTLVSSMLLFIAINFIIGMFLNTGLYILKDLIREYNKINSFNTLNLIRLSVLIIPHFAYSSCISGFIQIAWENNMCKVCKSPFIVEKCKSIERKSYFVFKSDKNPDGILEETLFLLFSSILYIVIILLFDYKIFHRLYQFAFNEIIGTGVSYKDVNEDPDVGGERDKVDAAKTHSSNASSPLLLVDDLVKKFSFKFTGVKGISFAVSPGECFGLLGVNGAGKTTTFRILTGDTFPSKGDASILTDKLYKLSSNINQYVSLIGYCPQFDAINDQLTGRETLKLMAILRGIPPKNTKKHVDKWIKLLGLEEYKDRLCGNYSGGNKRKLNTAMALIGDPPVVFLDEPTSGVDPVARRNLWQLLAASQRGGQAVVLTSHSMDECEALCNRLTIMVDGVMKCIGNIQYLKNRYGQGFTIMIKLCYIENFNVTDLKSDIERQFAPDINLKDEHKGLLHYHITNPNIPLSEIFGQMKAIKENYTAIEDYTVSDTTLEQVFIAFAKKQAVLNTT
ncbi:ATP-binding cassette sub-family A member 3-like isoform X2 [Rhopalosiphum maidis]|uniref:ATP-binding cassette sub-family A member 3-like isoform X2 n=1 Tax=Rhopalosiphum maidis TaxID=43146 RepID=UPI000F0072F9|nr:ATP-binding cassette sub-family A member 3-like isoform X2 [Rhopalosiphum maidis]